jgi:hypothetical protein
VHRLMSKEEGAEVERHLLHCDPCLLGLKEAMGITAISAVAR